MSFLWKLISSLFSGIHVGDKYEDKSTHDSAPKQEVSGLNSSANMTCIGTQNSYSYQGQQNANSGKGVQFVINGPCELNIPATVKTASPIPPLSDQAKSIMKQLAKSGHDGLVTWQPGAFIEELQTKMNQGIDLDEIDSVEDDLNCLVANMYLREPQKCPGGYGSIYDLTIKGKNFGKSLLAE